MNLVVHGLDASNSRQGNTLYDQIPHLVGQCDFVMANPPFNVDGVDTKKGEGRKVTEPWSGLSPKQSPNRIGELLG